MGGALLSGGHQSSSPFIVGFAGFILAQEGLRRAEKNPPERQAEIPEMSLPHE